MPLAQRLHEGVGLDHARVDRDRGHAAPQDQDPPVALTSGEHYSILLGVISSVMAGSLFGDHCSPISDTTIMSSMASGCDHIDHVRTQLPYAFAVGGVAMLMGDIPTSFGLHPAISLVLGVVVLYFVLRFFGRSTESVA